MIFTERQDFKWFKHMNAPYCGAIANPRASRINPKIQTVILEPPGTNKVNEITKTESKKDSQKQNTCQDGFPKTGVLLLSTFSHTLTLLLWLAKGH